MIWAGHLQDQIKVGFIQPASASISSWIEYDHNIVLDRSNTANKEGANNNRKIMIPPTDKRWHCPKCQLVNPPCERKCQMCKALRVPKDRIDTRMLLKELSEFCRSESLSKEGLRKIFERYGLAPDKKYVCNNYDYGFFRSACSNEKVTEGIIRCLLEYFPAAVRAPDDRRWSPLHFACCNKNVTLSIIEPLVEAAPDSVRCVSYADESPLHHLCCNSKVDEAAAMQILKFFLEKYPEAVRRADSDGDLPIHIAAGRKSPEFCRVLIEAYPGSEQIPDGRGALPLHYRRLPLHNACSKGSLATVEYLYRLYPDAITSGDAILNAVSSTKTRISPLMADSWFVPVSSPATAVEIVKFLLDCDPDQKLKQYEGKSLLQCACDVEYDDLSIEAGIQMIETLYDAHPEAIEDITIPAGIQDFHGDEDEDEEVHHRVQEFINRELVYAREAKDHCLMTTPDDNGQLPLHRALQNNASLVSIQLLVKGNPSAIRTADNNLAMPLHIACEHHDSAAVVQYLLDQLDTRTLRAVDIDNNTALHYACRSAKHDLMALLLEKYDAVSVSTRNVDGKLPIDLLWESKDSDRESVKYTESVFQLLKAHPEMLVMSNWAEKQPNDADATRNRKNRKSKSKSKKKSKSKSKSKSKGSGVNISNLEQPVDVDATRNGKKRKFGHEQIQ